MLSSHRFSGVLSKQILSNTNAYQLSAALQFATKVAAFVVGKAGGQFPGYFLMGTLRLFLKDLIILSASLSAQKILGNSILKVKLR